MSQISINRVFLILGLTIGIYFRKIIFDFKIEIEIFAI